MFSLILEILFAFEYIPHPKRKVKTSCLFILEMSLWREGFTLYKASKKTSKKLFSEEVNSLVGEW